MRFLIVDDSSTMRRIIINTLTKLGYQSFLEAGNGKEGLDRLGAGPLDKGLTAWRMPEMNGIDFVRHLRSREDGRAVPVLMVTTNAANADVSEALQAGVNNFGVTPFTADTLKEKIMAAAVPPAA